MSVLALLFLLCLEVTFSSTADITFKNISFKGYKLSAEIFKKTIVSSNKFVDFLPDSEFDKIEFRDQAISVIYENAFADIKDLEELLIENCDVREIKPGAFKNSLIRSLSLKGNKLEEIKEGIFSNLWFAVLDLSSNSITTIDDGAFNQMPNLLNIILSDNEISTYNKNFFEDTPLLCMINMKNNSIKLLPNGAFENLKGPKADLELFLVFSNNKIATIEPKAFQGLSSIHFLALDNNELKDFDENLLDNVNIELLMIEHNKIKCFSGDYKRVFRAKKTYMDYNPFDCICLESIDSFLKNSTNEASYLFAHLKCTTQKLAQGMEDIGKSLQNIASSEEN